MGNIPTAACRLREVFLALALPSRAGAVAMLGSSAPSDRYSAFPRYGATSDKRVAVFGLMEKITFEALISRTKPSGAHCGLISLHNFLHFHPGRTQIKSSPILYLTGWTTGMGKRLGLLLC